MASPASTIDAVVKEVSSMAVSDPVPESPAAGLAVPNPPAAFTAATAEPDDLVPGAAVAVTRQPAQDQKKASRKSKSKSRHGGRRSNDEDGHNQRTEQFSTRNLYMRGLPPDTTNESLNAMFAGYGEIVSAKAIMDREMPSVCKGFGFVMFQSPAAALAAVTELTMRGQSVQFAKVSPRRFPPGPGAKAAEDPTNLYFSNLPLDIDEEKLAAVLAPYGKVVSCRILRDYSTHASRGVGFARMQDRMTCEKIVTSLSGAILEEGAEPLQCKFADSPANRRGRFNPVGNTSGNTSHAHFDANPMGGPMSPLYIPHHQEMMGSFSGGMFYGVPALPAAGPLAGTVDATLPGGMMGMDVIRQFRAPMQFVPTLSVPPQSGPMYAPAGAIMLPQQIPARYEAQLTYMPSGMPASMPILQTPPTSAADFTATGSS